MGFIVADLSRANLLAERKLSDMGLMALSVCFFYVAELFFRKFLLNLKKLNLLSKHFSSYEGFLLELLLESQVLFFKNSLFINVSDLLSYLAILLTKGDYSLILG